MAGRLFRDLRFGTFLRHVVAARGCGTFAARRFPAVYFGTFVSEHCFGDAVSAT